MMELTLNDSLFVLSESSDSDENSSSDPTEEPSEQHLRRKQLNRFLESCNVEHLTRQGRDGRRRVHGHVETM